MVVNLTVNQDYEGSSPSPPEPTRKGRMRNRLEDLGRIYERAVDALYREDFAFSKIPGRTKDFMDVFNKFSKDRQEEFIMDLIREVSYLDEQLTEIMSIAEGSDRLNCIDQ